MLARNWLLSSRRPHQLAVLRGEDILLAAALLEDVSPVESDHDLVAEGLQQVDIGVVEGPTVPAVECGEDADHHAGGAEGHGGEGGQWQLGDREVARIGVHVRRDQRGLIGHHRAKKRVIHRQQLVTGDHDRPCPRHDPDEAPLLDHETDGRTLAGQQIRWRRPRRFAGLGPASLRRPLPRPPAAARSAPGPVARSVRSASRSRGTAPGGDAACSVTTPYPIPPIPRSSTIQPAGTPRPAISPPATAVTTLPPCSPSTAGGPAGAEVWHWSGGRQGSSGSLVPKLGCCIRVRPHAGLSRVPAPHSVSSSEKSVSPVCQHPAEIGPTESATGRRTQSPASRRRGSIPASRASGSSRSNGNSPADAHG